MEKPIHSKTIKLGKLELENILTGAGFYASGGGGDINLAQKLIARIFSMPKKKYCFKTSQMRSNRENSN